LETLLIDDWSHSNEFIGLLSLPCLQLVTELILNGPEVTDEILSLFIGNTVFPLLETLTLGCCGTTDGLLSRMISSRWAPSQAGYVPALPLKKIDVVFKTVHADALAAGDAADKRHYQQDLTQLKKFTALGLDASWKWPNPSRRSWRPRHHYHANIVHSADSTSTRCDLLAERTIEV
jgi:hypothetical protein